MSNENKVNPHYWIDLSKIERQGEGVQMEIPIKLDRVRKFKLNIKAIRLATAQLSKERGEKVNLMKEIDFDNFGIDEISLIMWVGLLSDDPTLTRDQSDEIMDVFGLIQSKELILNAINDSFPEVSDSIKKLVPSEQMKAVRKNRKTS